MYPIVELHDNHFEFRKKKLENRSLLKALKIFWLNL